MLTRICMFTDCFPVGILFLIKKLQKSKDMLIFAKKLLQYEVYG